jgi:hypothetical protein
MRCPASGARSEAAGFKHEDFSGEACLKQGQRHTGRLTRARRRLKHSATRRAQGADHVGQGIFDG